MPHLELRQRPRRVEKYSPGNSKTQGQIYFEGREREAEEGREDHVWVRY